MPTKADSINSKLKGLYSKYTDMFSTIPKYSNDYTYPTLMKCTPDFAKSDTKALFVDWESALWYRDMSADSPELKDSLQKSAKWVYNKYPETVDGYMQMYSDFTSDASINKDISKSKFWTISKIVADTIGVPYMFTYIMKSDVNMPLAKGFGMARLNNPGYREAAIWHDKFEDECHSILAEEIRIIKPRYIFFFGSGRLGRGEWSLPKILGSKIEYIPVDGNNMLTFVEQNSQMDTEVFLINSKTLRAKDTDNLKKALASINVLA